MNQKEPTKIFMMISNLKKPLVAMFFYKLIQRFKPFNRQIIQSEFSPT